MLDNGSASAFAEFRQANRAPDGNHWSVVKTILARCTARSQHLLGVFPGDMPTLQIKPPDGDSLRRLRLKKGHASTQG